MTDPKIVTLDIETAPIIASTFTLWPKNGIPAHAIIDDWWIVCASWKYLGQKKIHGVSVLDDKERFRADFTDDYHVLNKLHGVLMDADIIVGHNILKFDVPRINTRFIKHGLPPIPKKKFDDTYRMAKKEFSFTSNRLDFIAEYLGCGTKLDTPTNMWSKVITGDRKTIRDMLTYNKQDVRINEEVYLKLRPYMHGGTNLSIYVDDTELGATLKCPKCGSEHLQKRGHALLATGKYSRYQCQTCYGWSRGRDNLRAKKYTDVALTDQTVVG